MRSLLALLLALGCAQGGAALRDERPTRPRELREPGSRRLGVEREDAGHAGDALHLLQNVLQEGAIEAGGDRRSGGAEGRQFAQGHRRVVPAD